MTDLDQLVQPHRVHRSIYVDDAIFVEEMEKIFGGTWVYMAHESQVPRKDTYLTTRLGLRPVIVTRDSDGELRVLFNRCAHRASTVCQEESGTAKHFQCTYHGWTYSNRGDLVNVPYRDGYPANFMQSGHDLVQVPRVATHRGLIFATLNPDAPTLAEWLGPAAPLIDEFVDRTPNGEIELRNRQRMMYRGNWKLTWDNAADGLHPTFTHRSFVLLNDKRHDGARSLSQFKSNPDNTGMYGDDLGNGHMFVDQRPGLSRSFWDTQRPVPGKEWYEARIRADHGDTSDAVLEMAPGSMVNLSIFPNLLIKGNHLETIEPLRVDETRMHTWLAAAAGAPVEVNIMRMRIGEDFPSLGNPDDFEQFERCQEGLGIPEAEWIDVSKGLDDPLEQRLENGVRRGPVTYETPVRGYLRAWKELMQADPKRVVVGPEGVVREGTGG